MMRIKAVVAEMTWLAGILLVIVLTGLLLFYRAGYPIDKIHLQLDSTDFMFYDAGLVFLLFFTSSLLIYALKEAINQYNRILPNFILSGLLLGEMLIIASIIRIWSDLERVPASGWITDPLIETQVGLTEYKVNESVVRFNRVMRGIEILLVIGLFLLGKKTVLLLMARK